MFLNNNFQFLNTHIKRALGDRFVDHPFFLNLLDYWALLICFLFETYGTIVLLEFGDLEFSNTI